MENEAYNNLVRITKEDDYLIERTKAIWVNGFQKNRRKLIRNNKIEEFLINDVTWYRVLIA